MPAIPSEQLLPKGVGAPGDQLVDHVVEAHRPPARYWTGWSTRHPASHVRIVTPTARCGTWCALSPFSLRGSTKRSISDILLQAGTKMRV